MKSMKIVRAIVLSLEQLPKLDLTDELTRYLKDAYPPRSAAARGMALEMLQSLRLHPEECLSFGPFSISWDGKCEWKAQIITSSAAARLTCGFESNGETIYAHIDLH